MKVLMSRLVVYLFVVLPMYSVAQTLIPIPDANFRQYLITHFPSVMDVNNNLIKANAAAMQGSIACASLNISNVQGLQYFTTISSIDISNNQISAVPDLSALSVVTVVKLDHNKLTSLPALPRGHTLTGVYLQNNNLTFEDLLPLATYNNISNKVLTPQELIPVPATINSLGRSSLTINLGIDATQNNTYSWTKDNVADVIVTGSNVLEFASLTSSDAGVYTCTIKNNDPAWNAIGQPLLYTTTLRIVADSCYQFNDLQFSSKAIECQKDGELNITSSSQNPQAPISAIADLLQLEGVKSHAKVFSSNGVFPGLKETDYVLSYNDNNGCQLTKAGLVRIKNNSTDCPDIIITPDGDNKQDDLFIEDGGKIKIYNRSGVLVRELNGPAIWDGADAQGRHAMGIYIIQTEKRTFSVYVYL